MIVSLRTFSVETDWGDEALRTNLWLVPFLESVAALALFVVTVRIDEAAFHGTLQLPSFLISGSPDAARQILSSLAAAIITVVGVVFSIMFVTLTLASQQFGPRMLRNFIRDKGTQATLGIFVATFFYTILVLISIGTTFVPNLSITVALAVTVIDLAMFVYFIHHTAIAIQLPAVIANIARDLAKAIDADSAKPSTVSFSDIVVEHAAFDGVGPLIGPSPEILLDRLNSSGRVVEAPASGYIQFVKQATLVRIAAKYDAVIRLHYRPGHFLTKGHTMATVWPRDASHAVGRALEKVHITGPLRTLSQDIAFGIDQLVEIAIRALSPAVNDTFTALTCIDWIGDSLCQVAVRWHPQPCHRDRIGLIRLITVPIGYERLVRRSFEKVRQAADGMPAVLIRQLDALAKVMAVAPSGRAQVLVDQAAMIVRICERTVPELADQADIFVQYQALLAIKSERFSEDGALR